MAGSRKELRQDRHLDGFVVIVESDFPALIRMRGGLSEQSIIGTVAAWSGRYGPILFAGDAPRAAQLAWRFLSQPVEEARRLVAKAEDDRSVRPPPSAPSPRLAVCAPFRTCLPHFS